MRPFSPMKRVDIEMVFSFILISQKNFGIAGCQDEMLFENSKPRLKSSGYSAMPSSKEITNIY
ncbi:MAG TPA: hypothetical protein V6D09_21660 [Leptolyngbyaceae cyanobacterium]